MISNASFYVIKCGRVYSHTVIDQYNTGFYAFIERLALAQTQKTSKKCKKLSPL